MGTALDEFMREKNEIDKLLCQLKGLSDEHFDTPSDDVNYNHVGDLRHIRVMLDDIVTFAITNTPKAKADYEAAVKAGEV